MQNNPLPTPSLPPPSWLYFNPLFDSRESMKNSFLFFFKYIYIYIYTYILNKEKDAYNKIINSFSIELILWNGEKKIQLIWMDGEMGHRRCAGQVIRKMDTRGQGGAHVHVWNQRWAKELNWEWNLHTIFPFPPPSLRPPPPGWGGGPKGYIEQPPSRNEPHPLTPPPLWNTRWMFHSSSHSFTFSLSLFYRVEGGGWRVGGSSPPISLYFSILEYIFM